MIGVDSLGPGKALPLFGFVGFFVGVFELFGSGEGLDVAFFPSLNFSFAGLDLFCSGKLLDISPDEDDVGSGLFNSFVFSSTIFVMARARILAPAASAKVRFIKEAAV